MEILEDPEDTRENLNLARREAEFEKDTGILCRNEYKDRLSRCAFLSLYNNKIETLTNIAVFAHSPLELLNLGRNELTELPDDVCNPVYTTFSIYLHGIHLMCMLCFSDCAIDVFKEALDRRQ